MLLFDADTGAVKPIVTATIATDHEPMRRLAADAVSGVLLEDRAMATLYFLVLADEEACILRHDGRVRLVDDE